MDAVDRDLAIRTVLAEASGQGPDGMAAVAHVIRNRSAVGRYGGKSVGEVVTAKNQFEPWNDVGAGKPNDPMGYAPTDPGYQRAAKIVDAVFSGALPDPTRGATHFYAPKAQSDLGRKAPSWAKGQQGLKIGDHMFYAPDGTVSDLSQGLGDIGQNPDAPVPKMAASMSPANMPGASAGPAAGGGATAGGNMSQTDLLRMFMGQMGKPAAATPQHGAFNQLLFGPQGWQGKLGQSMPNGLLGALFGGLGGGAAPGATPVAAPAGPAAGGMGAPMQLGLPSPTPAPAPMPAPAAPAPSGMDVMGAPIGAKPEGPPMLAGAGGAPGGGGSPLSLLGAGSGGGAGGGNPLSLLASMFGLG